MMPAGIEEVDKAKKDGRWARAYDSSSVATVPDDFLKALAKEKKAKAFFETLGKTKVYSIISRLHHAKKPETRQKWITTIIDMLNRGETFHQ